MPAFEMTVHYIETLFFVATGLFFAGSVCFWLFVGRGNAIFGRCARLSSLGAGICQLGMLAHIHAANRPSSALAFAFAAISAGITFAFLAGTLKHGRLLGLGAFLIPASLIFHLIAGFVTGVSSVSTEVRSAIIPFHVAANVLGIVAFAIASTSAIVYVIQEKALRRKKVVGAFERLPGLHMLDAISSNALLIGFPLFTLGIVTGTFWISAEAPANIASGARPFAFVAWLLFAQVLALRAIGWRGRRAALGTIVGFCFSLVVLAGYIWQSGSQV